MWQQQNDQQFVHVDNESYNIKKKIEYRIQDDTDYMVPRCADFPWGPEIDQLDYKSSQQPRSTVAFGTQNQQLSQPERVIIPDLEIGSCSLPIDLINDDD